MKKIFSFIILTVFLFGFFSKNTFAEEKYFVVTAYYSPLPGQEYYMRGNLEKEKILQGEGTHGASGKSIFSGMLAAPKTYDFGTKIYLEGLGVGVVEDRGQAIVKKGERGYKHDRLDVWMGYGDEGLKRALAWGKRKVKGKVLEKDAKVTINYKEHPAPNSAVSHLKSQKREVFKLGLGKKSKDEDVKKLQLFLQEIGLYKGKIDGVYNSEIISIIFDFQVKNGILKKETDIGAGFWGEKTRNLFKQKYFAGEFKIEKKDINIFLEFDFSDESIKKVEKIFKEMKFLDENENLDKQNFSKNILKFQLEEKIISSENEPGAGNYGPKTRAKLKEKYEIFKDKKIEEEERKIHMKEKYEFIEKESEKLAENRIKNLKNKIIKKGEISQEVRELQDILGELGYFSDKTTAIYGEKTFEAVLDFQIKNNLVESKKSEFAGVIGEKNIYELKNNLKNLYINKKIEENRFEQKDLEIIKELQKV